MTSEWTFHLRFDGSSVEANAARYDSADDCEIGRLQPVVKARGGLTLEELQQVCRWKSPRTGPRVAKNSDEEVRGVTGFALSTPSERLRIEALALLNGVAMPAASVILHWFHQDRYPILDFRALWSLSIDTMPPHTFGLWQAYTAACRKLADQHCNGCMRTLDRALWQYSKENQRSLQR